MFDYFKKRKERAIKRSQMIEMGKRCLSLFIRPQKDQPNQNRRSASNVDNYIFIENREDGYDVIFTTANRSVLFSYKEVKDGIEINDMKECFEIKLDLIEIKFDVLFKEPFVIKKENMEKFFNELGIIYEENLRLIHMPQDNQEKYWQVIEEIRNLVMINKSSKLPKFHELGIL